MKRTQKQQNAVQQVTACLNLTLSLYEQRMSAMPEIRLLEDEIADGFQAIKRMLAERRGACAVPARQSPAAAHPKLPARRAPAGVKGPPPKPDCLPQDEYERVVALKVNNLKREIRLRKADVKDGRKYDLQEQLLLLLEEQYQAQHSHSSSQPPTSCELAGPCDDNAIMTALDDAMPSASPSATQPCNVGLAKLKSPPKVSEDAEMSISSKVVDSTTCTLDVHNPSGRYNLEGLASSPCPSPSNDEQPMEVDSGRKRSRSPPVIAVPTEVVKESCSKSPLRKFAKVDSPKSLEAEVPTADNEDMKVDRSPSCAPTGSENGGRSKTTMFTASKLGLSASVHALTQSFQMGSSTQRELTVTRTGNLPSLSSNTEQYLRDHRAEIDEKMRSKTKLAPLVKQLRTPTLYEQNLSKIRSASKLATELDKRKEMDAMIRQKARDQPLKQPPSKPPLATQVQPKVLESLKKKPGLVIPSLTGSSSAAKVASTSQGSALRRAPKSPPPPPPQAPSPGSDNYEISDHERDSDSDDDVPKPKKRIPLWAQRPQLGRALELQFNGPVRLDPDAIFGEVKSCDLEQVFNQSKARYRKRTSSGVWTNDRVTEREKHLYKQSYLQGRACAA